MAATTLSAASVIPFPFLNLIFVSCRTCPHCERGGFGCYWEPLHRDRPMMPSERKELAVTFSV